MLTRMIGVRSFNPMKPDDRKYSLSPIAAFESAPNVLSALTGPKRDGQILFHAFGQTTLTPMLLAGVVDNWDSSPKAHVRSSPSPSLKPTSGSLTKEEKAAEMARRKEERKQVCCG